MFKIAIPTRNGMIDERFGHCQSLTIFHVDANNDIITEEIFTPPKSCGCKSNMIPTLAKKGVTVLIGGNMGDSVVTCLSQGRDSGYAWSLWPGASCGGGLACGSTQGHNPYHMSLT